MKITITQILVQENPKYNNKQWSYLAELLVSSELGYILSI